MQGNTVIMTSSPPTLLRVKQLMVLQSGVSELVQEKDDPFKKLVISPATVGMMSHELTRELMVGLGLVHMPSSRGIWTYGELNTVSPIGVVVINYRERTTLSTWIGLKHFEKSLLYKIFHITTTQISSEASFLLTFCVQLKLTENPTMLGSKWSNVILTVTVSL